MDLLRALFSKERSRRGSLELAVDERGVHSIRAFTAYRTGQSAQLEMPVRVGGGRREKGQQSMT